MYSTNILSVHEYRHASGSVTIRRANDSKQAARNGRMHIISPLATANGQQTDPNALARIVANRNVPYKNVRTAAAAAAAATPRHRRLR